MIVLNPSNIKEIITALKNGAVLVCPTDTVYGLACDALNEKAVEKIYKIKKRPKNKPLSVFVKDLKMAKEIAEIGEKQEKILKKYWPGKFTFVLNKKNKKGTIALRIPKYKFLNDLLKKINNPLAQTSANISGQLPLIKISDIISQFGKLDILAIDAGDLKKSKPSKIIYLTSNKIKILRK